MELLNPPPSVPNRLQISSFTPKFSIRTCITKHPRKFHISTVKFHRLPSLRFSLPSSAHGNFHVSARFGGPTSRRNSLRKKLIDDQQQQVRENGPTSSDFQSPSLSLDCDSRGNMGYDSVKESGYSYGVGDQDGDSDDVTPEGVEGLKLKTKKLGESVLLSKLESWVDQYKKDTAYWGIGVHPIFTVFHDIEGIVGRVEVNEEEIMKRSQVERREFEDLSDVNKKILCAKGLAWQMERDGNAIPRNSSVTKFVVLGKESDYGFVDTVRAVVLRPDFVPVLSRVGRLVLFGCVAIWALKKLFTFGNKEEKYTGLEKEMMRRKIKSRKEKEALEKGETGVVDEPVEPPTVSIERPKLDRQELMKSILETEAAKDKMVVVESSNCQATKASDFDSQVQKIREMARQAREIENREQPTEHKDGEGKQTVTKESSSDMKVVQEHGEEINFPRIIQDRDLEQTRDVDTTRVEMPLEESKCVDTEHLRKDFPGEDRILYSPIDSSAELSSDRQVMVTQEVAYSPDTLDDESGASRNSLIRTRPRVILSVQEAREFLAMKGGKHVEEPQVDSVLKLADNKLACGIASQTLNSGTDALKMSPSGSKPVPLPVANACEDSTHKDRENIAAEYHISKDSNEGHGVTDFQSPQTSLNHDTSDRNTEEKHSVKMENWLEKNFCEVEPVVEKIKDGFRNNYKAAREKVNQDARDGLMLFDHNKDDSELEWMKDDNLREIVFKVQENELTGRDPFYLMDAEDKRKFFEGLDEIVEKENEKLVQVHEYLHSNIENLDYGADGISLYDSPEKFIPRWKGPSLEKTPEFLDNYLEERNAIFSRSSDTSHPVKKDEQNLLHKSAESQVNEKVAGLSKDSILKNNISVKNQKVSKTVIEGSDGSIRAGKKSGKEYWQHTKKWSHGFLESYNAETDPEVKAIMKDIGKDLDRWITEEEIQEAANLMDKVPEKNKKFIEKKINKLKREMELFGPQAVVSKYSEYADGEEEDYLWWLDLPHVLCIELYTTENEEQRMGFYSLEMAADLELEPKPYHVIAFEDAGDCKNLCYIVQAHMDMLGNGHAFVVPRPPKDAFREAKANDFGVTVIRKGELQLNVDQPLEEVEEQITEIGGKIYHDMLMRERSVDINSLMKGIFGASGQPTSSKSKRKRSRRALKKPNRKS